MEVDLATWAGIAAAVTLIIEFLKMFFSFEAKVSALIALGLGVLLAIVAKGLGIGWVATEWATLIINGVFLGLSGQLIHNGILNPLKGKNPSA